MKHTILIKCILLGFMLSFILSACSYSEKDPKNTLDDYSKIMSEGIPDDLCLTIYYINPKILTRMPLTAENLMTFPGVRKIAIDSEELSKQSALLKNLDSSMIKTVKEETYVNARLYYVFEMGNGRKILQVTINEIYGCVFVNGYEVEHNPIFYEIIAPFLKEEDRITLGF